MRTFIALLINTLLLGCAADDVSPIFKSPTFETILLRTELPSNVGHIDLTNVLVQDLYDATIIGDKSLIIIGGSLYSYESNIYTEILTDARQVVRTSGGILYVVGSDALYISLDDGVSFTKQDKFISNLGNQFALDVYYNGSPNNILVRRVSSNEYVMWLYTAYKYSLGGTGFSTTRYQNFVFTSSDGMNWEYESEAGAKSNSYPAAIDDDGTVYLAEVQTDGQTYTRYEFYKSFDLGINRELVESDALIPNTISNHNKLFHIDRIAIDDRFQNNFKQRDDKSWIDINPTIDEKAKGANAGQLIIQRVNFTSDGRMILINTHGIYLSDQKF